MIAQRSDVDTVARTLNTLVDGLNPGDFVRGATVKGSAHSVSFTTTLPLSAGSWPTREADVTLSVDGRRQLSLAWLEHIPNWLGKPRTPHQAMLVDHVERLDIEYWRNGPDGAGTWVGAWSTPGIPRLMRFRISRQSGRERAWPDIIVAPMRDRFQP